MLKVDRPPMRGFLGADCDAPMIGLALCSCGVHIDLSVCSCLEAVFLQAATPYQAYHRPVEALGPPVRRCQGNCAVTR